MKKIGDSEAGGVLVELYVREYELLERLYRAWRGAPMGLYDVGAVEAGGRSIPAQVRGKLELRESERCQLYQKSLEKRERFGMRMVLPNIQVCGNPIVGHHYQSRVQRVRQCQRNASLFLGADRESAIWLR